MHTPTAEQPRKKSILLAAPKTNQVYEAAIASMNLRFSAPPEDIGIPSDATDLGLEMDTNYGVVPILPIIERGSRAKETAFTASDAIEQSSDLIMRAFIEDTGEAIPEKIGEFRVNSDPPVQHTACMGDPAIGTIEDVKDRMQIDQLIANGLDGSDVALAVVDTGIDRNFLANNLNFNILIDAANSYNNTQHNQPAFSARAPGTGWHGTMVAYNALQMAPKATLIDCPVITGRVPGQTGLSGTLSLILKAYAELHASWAVAFATGGLHKYKALVINNSWAVFQPDVDFAPGHRGRYIDNPNHAFNRAVSALSGSGADIIFAAGNCGPGCPAGKCKNPPHSIMGAQSLQDVLTVGGIDLNENVAAYSSQGPGMFGLSQRKPDIAAFTHHHGSDLVPADNGTSTACPIAAGCIAALRSSLSSDTLPPPNLFAQIRAVASQPGSQTGWRKDIGHGIIDPLKAAKSLGLISP